jgi:hypothetical protein
VALWIKDYGVRGYEQSITDDIGSQLFQAGRGARQGSLDAAIGFNGRFNYTCGWNTTKLYQDAVPWGNKLGLSEGYGSEGYSSGDHPLDQWVHYAFVKDATAGVMRIYQNGKIVAEQSGTTGLLMPALVDPLLDFFTLGAWRWSSGTGGYYYGLMDDFRLYSRALSQQEIMTLAGVSSLHQPVLSSAEVTDDDIVNFKDFAVVAAEWLEEPLLWP